MCKNGILRVGVAMSASPGQLACPSPPVPFPYAFAWPSWCTLHREPPRAIPETIDLNVSDTEYPARLPARLTQHGDVVVEKLLRCLFTDGDTNAK